MASPWVDEVRVSGLDVIENLYEPLAEVQRMRFDLTTFTERSAAPPA